VNDSKTLRLLVVEDNLEDEEFLCEALIEIEEHRQWCNWRTAGIVHAGQLSDAVDCLRREWFDAVLLNLSLPDSPALLNSFLEVNALARGAPIVVLADEDDENLANLLLREGAQDVLLKSELECAPLARSLRYAIERQRRTSALRSRSLEDDLTGTLTREGFFAVAEYYRNLSKHASIDLILASIQIDILKEGMPEDRDLRELLLLRAGDLLRGAFPTPAIIGRLEPWRFGLIIAASNDVRVANLLSQTAVQIEDAVSRGLHQVATVCFSATDLEPEDNLEELVAAEPEPSKTAMLAD